MRRSMGVLVLLMAPPFALLDREVVFSVPATAGTNDAMPFSFRVSVRLMGCCFISTGRLRGVGMTCSYTTSRVLMHTSRRRFSLTIHSIASMETLHILFVHGCSVDTVHGLTVTQGNRNTMEL